MILLQAIKLILVGILLGFLMEIGGVIADRYLTMLFPESGKDKQ